MYDHYDCLIVAPLRELGKFYIFYFQKETLKKIKSNHRQNLMRKYVYITET